MDTFLYLATSLLLVGFIFLIYTVRGSNPKNRVTVTGRLTDSNTVKNVTIRSRKYKYFTTYTYTYVIGNRTYRRKGESTERHRRNLHRTAEFVYQKGFPRFAYKDKYTGEVELVITIVCIVAGVTFLLFYLFNR